MERAYSRRTNASTAPRSMPGSARRRRQRCCANSSESCAESDSAPDLCGCIIFGTLAPRIAGAWAEVLAVTDPELLEPATFVQLHADILRRDAGIDRKSTRLNSSHSQ